MGILSWLFGDKFETNEDRYNRLRWERTAKALMENPCECMHITPRGGLIKGECYVCRASKDEKEIIWKNHLTKLYGKEWVDDNWEEYGGKRLLTKESRDNLSNAVNRHKEIDRKGRVND